MKELVGECMLWARAVDNNGYGRARYMVFGKPTNITAHRMLYEDKYGEIPKGMVLDHLCRTKRCINPDHLEPVTNRENIIRGVKRDLKTHCINGHDWLENSFVMNKRNGHMRCKICYQEQRRRYLSKA